MLSEKKSGPDKVAVKTFKSFFDHLYLFRIVNLIPINHEINFFFLSGGTILCFFEKIIFRICPIFFFYMQVLSFK